MPRNPPRRFSHYPDQKAGSACVETSGTGTPGFTQVYGRYTDRDAAERASAHVKDLAPAVKPWIRPMVEVQKQITGIVFGKERMANPAAIKAAVSPEASPDSGDTATETTPPNGTGPEAKAHE